MDKTKIIVVEDNIVYCEYVCNMLSREGYHTMKAYHLSTAKKHLQQATDNDIVVADLRLPDGNGIDLLRWMRKEGKMQPFIIMTDYAEVHTAVESMKLGSIDYIPKQLVEDKLVPLLRSIQKERQAGQRRMPVFAREGSAFQKIMHRIRLVAATDMSVMIFGENGTGKEHIAHHLHDKSKRAGKPFVAVDCGSLTKELAPSAFFGHVKGAFTGADSTKKGYFYEAEGGTLFLDEVGNLALETQQMLLRAIQERRYRPIGDKSDRSFNVRIIAATNEDLEAAVSEKRFRQDLFYRLHDFGITVPPLRDCQEDILPLAETDFFRLINEAGDCNMETAYTAFATQVIELCNGGMDMNLTVIALAYIEIELQHHPVRNLSEEKREIAAYVSKALSFVRKMQKFLATPQVPPLISANNATETTASLLQWTGNAIDLVELIYGIDEMGCINNGNMPLKQLAPLLYKIFGVESKDCYRFYTDIKRRKNESRTYFLDRMQEKLNERMLRDDELDRMRR